MVNQRVDDVLAGSATSPEEIGTLTKELKAALHFATARKLLGAGLNL